MGAKMSNYWSRRSEVCASGPEKSSWNSRCYLNLKHPSRFVVPLPTLRRHPRTILRPDKAVRVRRIPGRNELSVLRRLCGQGQTVHRDHLPHAGLQDQKPWELLHAARQPRVFQHQSHLRLLRRMYSRPHSGKRKYNIKLWKTFSDVFNVMPVCALID